MPTLLLVLSCLFFPVVHTQDELSLLTVVYTSEQQPDDHIFNVVAPRAYWVHITGENLYDVTRSRYFVTPNSNSNPCSNIPATTYQFDGVASSDSYLQPEQTVSFSQGIQHPWGHAVCLSLDGGQNWHQVGTIPAPCCDVIKVGVLFLVVYLFLSLCFNHPNSAVYQVFPSLVMSYLILFLDSAVSPGMLLACVVVMMLVTYSLVVDFQGSFTKLVLLFMLGMYMWPFVPKDIKGEVDVFWNEFLTWATSGLCSFTKWIAIPFFWKVLCDVLTVHPEGHTTLGEGWGWVAYVVCSLLVYISDGFLIIEHGVLMVGVVLIGYFSYKQGFGNDCFETSKANRELARAEATSTTYKDRQRPLQRQQQARPIAADAVQPVYSGTTTTMKSFNSLLNEPTQQQFRTTMHTTSVKQRTAPKYEYTGSQESENVPDSISQRYPAAQQSVEDDEEMLDAPLKKRSSRNYPKQSSKRNAEHVADPQDTPQPKVPKRSPSTGSKNGRK